jgi:hypothetical protein
MPSQPVCRTARRAVRSRSTRKIKGEYRITDTYAFSRDAKFNCENCTILFERTRTTNCGACAIDAESARLPAMALSNPVCGGLLSLLKWTQMSRDDFRACTVQLVAACSASVGACLAATACAAIPSIDFVADDASTSIDGSISTDSAAASEAGGSVPDANASPPIDAGRPDTTSGLDASPPCALPTGYDAGCCAQTVAPCVGIACEHCGACAQQACRANQFCCAHLDTTNTYKNVTCAADPKNCP